MKLFKALLQLNKSKPSILSEDQQNAITVGREQFQKLMERKLTVPVAFL